MNVESLIRAECQKIADLLAEKNRKYGNASLAPNKVFSPLDALARIDVRIDDKLQRIANRQNDEDEDVILDLTGYLILRRVYVQLQSQERPHAID